ncbi:hypothetical protein Cni_G11199 [Canna indica]|uniref:Polysaccharide biosynthesis domain-containing protein n=1 Tax=Canna indica TaxID=4628 RepID=A0AAQ3K7M2_9LILI|nr:hypothetical protein Cni_G11199 [Canna indica]
MLPKKAIIIIIILVIFSTLSLLKLYTLAPDVSELEHTTSPSLRKFPDAPYKVDHHASPPAEDVLSPKEYQLLSNLISRKTSCNLLFFGIKPQFLALAALNSAGTAIFLEDDPEKLKAQAPKGVGIYLVKNHEKAGKAFELLEHARKHPSCRLQAGLLTSLTGSKCRLVLKGLPAAVYGRKWDVIVIDGPSGDRPEAPGRMGAIFTAAVLAHKGLSTDVFVHDTDHMIEKWYSWEFLCHENMVSSKGKLWHFRITANSSSDRFCPQAAVQIL